MDKYPDASSFELPGCVLHTHMAAVHTNVMLPMLLCSDAFTHAFLQASIRIRAVRSIEKGSCRHALVVDIEDAFVNSVEQFMYIYISSNRLG